MICLTFDTDYVRDDVLQEFLKQFPFPGNGTFFLWDTTTNLNWGGHEIEPHPSFGSRDSWFETLDRHVQSLRINPRGLRSHSCAYTQILGIELAKRNYDYVSMVTPLFQTGLRPYRHPWGIWELPIYYMDNMDYCFEVNWVGSHKPFRRDVIDAAMHGMGCYVFDFHPLHVIMNTRSFADYCSVREQIISGERSPFEVWFEGRGVGTYFKELCQAMATNGLRSHTCLEALKAHQGEHQPVRAGTASDVAT